MFSQFTSLLRNSLKARPNWARKATLLSVPLMYQYSRMSCETDFKVPDQIKAKSKSQRIMLVLDLDETLVYARDNQLPIHNRYVQFSLGDEGTFYAQLRPHLQQFLAGVGQAFTVVIYTAGTKDYADKVIDLIDKNKVIGVRFYRDSCVPHKGSFIKDLNLLRRKMGAEQRMVLVDDNQRSINLNAPNSILVIPFEGDQKDEELRKVFKTLMDLYME